jgi:hypothetical protein
MNLPFSGQFTISQQFGENPDYYKQFSLSGHDGLDWDCPDGTTIIAAESGRVMQPSATRDFGNFVAIWHPALHIMSWYCHLRSSSVQPGSIVSKGQVIGLSNNTGISRGTHLHFAVSQVDNDGQIINKGNGYAGFINPLPFLEMTQPSKSKEDFLVTNVVAGSTGSTGNTSIQTFDVSLKPLLKWLSEGIKTSGRFTLILFISSLIDTLTKTQVGLQLPDSTKWIVALVLAGLDRVVHEWRKDSGEEGDWKGLVGF